MNHSGSCYGISSYIWLIFLGIGTGYQGFMDLKWLGGMNGHIKKQQVSSQLLLGVAIIP